MIFRSNFGLGSGRRTKQMSHGHDPDRCVVSIGTITRADVPALCERLRTLVEGHDIAVVACEVGAAAVDLATVETLVRLQLTARRLGCRIRLHDASRELGALLALCGLEEVLATEERS
jgi:ABC-type transporter Mla MlaB component